MQVYFCACYPCFKIIQSSPKLHIIGTNIRLPLEITVFSHMTPCSLVNISNIWEEHSASIVGVEVFSSLKIEA